MATYWRRLKKSPISRFSDPYFERLNATNPGIFGNGKRGRAAKRDRNGEQDWFRVIIELKPPLTSRNFALGNWHRKLRPPPGWRDWIHVPPVYANPPAGLDNISFCTAFVTTQFFEMLTQKQSRKKPKRRLLRDVIKRFQLGSLTERKRKVKFLAANAPLPGPLLPGIVVTGIVDDGIAFAHDRFRHANGRTRIEYFWDQDDRWSPFYGRELSKDDAPGGLGIDSLMANATHAGAVDEDEVYRVTRHLDYAHLEHKAAAWRVAHGTHVMDLACGFEPAAAPPTRPIVCVQLPGKTTADTSGRRLDPYVLDALFYILRRADDLAVKYQSGPLPVVVNLSYSVIAPNEYTEILVPAIDQLIRGREALGVPMAVTLPAGNDFLSRGHARFGLKAVNGTRPMRWQVQPDDATDSLLEIWLQRSNAVPYPYKVKLKVRTPTGDASPWIGEGEVWIWQPATGELCHVTYENAVAYLRRNRIGLWIAPTVTDDPGSDVAPCGIWDITVRNDGGPAVRVAAWIQRDDSPYGYARRGRQSRFEDSDYVRYDPISGRELEVDNPASYVKRFGTINRLATGSNTVVLGGFRRSDWVPAKYSAAGPVEPPAGVMPPYRVGPDAMAPSEDSPACHGQLGAGSRSGGAVAMAGTSVAAPRIARWIADRMAVPAPSDRAAVALRAQIPPNGVPVAVPGPPPNTLLRAGAGGIEVDAPSALPPVVPQVRPRNRIQRRER